MAHPLCPPNVMSRDVGAASEIGRKSGLFKPAFIYSCQSAKDSVHASRPPACINDRILFLFQEVRGVAGGHKSLPGSPNLVGNVGGHLQRKGGWVVRGHQVACKYDAACGEGRWMLRTCTGNGQYSAPESPGLDTLLSAASRRPSS
jgi:hypothetical protein